MSKECESCVIATETDDEGHTLFLGKEELECALSKSVPMNNLVFLDNCLDCKKPLPRFETELDMDY
jgi:hypothetical protein